MIMTVNELRTFITTTETDQGLVQRLQALESMIRKYTHNKFQMKGIRTSGNISGEALFCDTSHLKNGDTIEISEAELNAGLYVIANMTAGMIPLPDAFDENNVLVTKIVYPVDVKMGVANMIRWDLENRKKVGIQSETISRHSVTYFNMDGDNSLMGYPKSLLGFLKPYMKARF